MRGFFIGTLLVFLTCPAFGQYVYGEAGVTLPLQSFSYAKTGFQSGVTGRLPIQMSDLDVAATLRIGYNVNPIPQGEIRRLTGLMGPEVSYTRGHLFTRAQIGGGMSVPLDEDRDTAWLVRSRIALGVETSRGSQLSIGPTYAVTGTDEMWWGISSAFSF